MSKKAREQKKRTRAWHRYYENIIALEKEKRAGYEELAKLHSAYVSTLLNRLGATEDNKIEFTPAEITEALAKYEARAVATDNGFALYTVPKEE